MTITDVRTSRTGLWVITDDRGTTYATKNAWLASIAKEAWERGLPVAITDGRGWFYRTLLAIAIIRQQEVAS